MEEKCLNRFHMTSGAATELQANKGESAQIAALEAELGELQAERGRVTALKQRLDKALAELESERRELKQSRACPHPPAWIPNTNSLLVVDVGDMMLRVT